MDVFSPSHIIQCLKDQYKLCVWGVVGVGVVARVGVGVGVGQVYLHHAMLSVCKLEVRRKLCKHGYSLQ